MGGNALPDGLTERKPARDYLMIKNEVLQTLNSIDSPIVAQSITEMPEKTSYGDLDLLCTIKETSSMDAVTSFVQSRLSPKASKRNGDIFSFEFCRFQIDLIICTPESLSMHEFMLSYGDRGMILGQLAKAHGLSLTNHGLHISIKDLAFEPWTSEERAQAKRFSEKSSLALQGSLLLSRNPHEICAFLGLPTYYDFATESDVVEFIRCSRLFHPSIFLRHSLNSKEAQKRFQNRPFYRKFVLLVANDFLSRSSSECCSLEVLPEDSFELIASILNKFDWVSQYAINKASFQLEALEKFDKLKELKLLKATVIRNLEISSKLNGKMLIDLAVPVSKINDAKTAFLNHLVDVHGSSASDEEKTHVSSAEDIMLLLSKESVFTILTRWMAMEDNPFRAR